MNRESMALIVVGIPLLGLIAAISYFFKRGQSSERIEDQIRFDGVCTALSFIAVVLLITLFFCFRGWLQTIPSGVVNK